MLNEWPLDVFLLALYSPTAFRHCSQLLMGGYTVLEYQKYGLNCLFFIVVCNTDFHLLPGE